MASTAITLKNGVWVHETEWFAIQRLISCAETVIANNPSMYELRDAYWAWRNADMDVEAANRVIRSLTNMVGELTQGKEDDTVESMF